MWAKVILGVILLLCLGAPVLATHDPLTPDLNHTLARPSREHILGTDLLGRDVYSRLLYGGRRSLLLAGGGAVVAIGGGLVLGVGAFGFSETVFSSVINVLLAVPSLLTALMVISLLDNRASSLILALGISGMGAYGRTVRDALLQLEKRPYVESAISVGATRQRIIWFHLLPNTLPILSSFGGIIFGWTLLNGAGLSFLGFVENPDTPDWGVMLAAGRQTFAQAPWEALSAGLMISLVVGAVNRVLKN